MENEGDIKRQNVSQNKKKGSDFNRIPLYFTNYLQQAGYSGQAGVPFRRQAPFEFLVDCPLKASELAAMPSIARAK